MTVSLWERQGHIDVPHLTDQNRCVLHCIGTTGTFHPALYNTQCVCHHGPPEPPIQCEFKSPLSCLPDDIPEVSCNWSGVATLPGTWIMMNAMCGKGVIIHELGHNYGLQHSNVLSVAGVSVGLEDRCCDLRKGHEMGHNYGLEHFNILALAGVSCAAPYSRHGW